MNNEDFYDLVLSRVMRPSDAAMRAFAVTECAVVLRRLERGPFHPWFLETADSVTASTETETTAVPADYLILVEDSKVRVEAANGEKTPLKRMFHEDLITNRDEFESDAGTGFGIPLAYDIWADLFWWGPVPDIDYTVYFKYFAKSTAPPDDGDPATNPWVLNADDYLAISVAERLARFRLRNAALAKDLAGEARDLRAELFKYNEARKHVDKDYEVNN